jgi:glyoxylase-like metal-dependent hydrolase (beta-lactamase superfamily II)
MKTTHPERLLKQKSTLAELTAYIASLLQEQTEHFDSKRQNQIDFLKEIETSLPGLELVLPNETFTKEYTFTGSKRTGRIFTLGGGHSLCDGMLYLPEDQVLFTGDLLFVNTHPSLFPESNPSEWITILEKMTDLEIEWAIPGHGPVGTLANVSQLIRYFNMLITVAKGSESFDADPLIIPEIYQNWASPEMFSQNLNLLKETLLVD